MRANPDLHHFTRDDFAERVQRALVTHEMAPPGTHVASAVSGIPEAVTSGEEGLLTAPGDTEALAAALRQLLGDSALRDRLGRAARARAEAEFTVARMADQYERLYADKPTHG